MKGKGEKEKYTHSNADFQRIARREPGPFEALPSGAESPGKSEHGRNRLPSETPVSEKEKPLARLIKKKKKGRRIKSIKLEMK